MKFEISLGKLPLDASLIKKAAPELAQIMKEELLNTRARIVSDTVAGRQAEGGSLKPYSASYIKAIDSGTVAGKAPGNHTPNLTATGTLMRSIVIEQGDTPFEVRAFFQGSHPPARRVFSAGAQRKQKKAGIAPKSYQGQTVKLGRSRGGRRGRSGGDTQNAVIAQGQYDMGRIGWFTFAKKDIERIQKRVGDLITKLLSSLK